MRRRMLVLSLVGIWVGIEAGIAQTLDAQFNLLRPGLTKEVVHELPSPSDPNTFCFEPPSIPSSFVCERGEGGYYGPAPVGGGADATGAFYELQRREDPLRLDECAPPNLAIDSEIVRLDQGTAEVIARVPRCVVVAGIHYTNFPTNVSADAVNGALFIAVRNTAYSPATGQSVLTSGIVRIGGLPTLLDIVATYQPAGSFTLNWNVPRHPEALPSADRFQVFAGTIVDLPDFTRASVVDCTVPDSGSPRAGDFLSMLDPLPVPPPGEALYVVVGVESAGQRRFGRQNIGGTLTGRDPTLFPACG